MRNKPTLLVVMATCALFTACSSSGSDTLSGHTDDTPAPSATTAPPVGTPAVVMRTDYGEALRTASLKLVGELPALADIKAIGDAASDNDRKNIYGGLIDKYLADPRFATTQIAWWKNTLKTGTDPDAEADPRAPSMDSAATFAAGTFTPASCTNGAATAGVLSDPGLMAQYTSNMAFRRVRFVQETFACAKFPAEIKQPGAPMGSGIYTSPWDFDSIAGGASAKVDFHDTSAAVCANCHTTINHLAPLFGNFDAHGKMNTTIQVMTPVTPPVLTTLADWLPDGQPLAWRNGVNVTDLPSLGAAMAKDPDVARCEVVRTWNWAFSRGDVVNDGATMPTGVIESIQAAFVADGMKIRSLIRSVFTSDDFTKF